MYLSPSLALAARQEDHMRCKQEPATKIEKKKEKNDQQKTRHRTSLGRRPVFRIGVHYVDELLRTRQRV
jgi:hypothetical protein